MTTTARALPHDPTSEVHLTVRPSGPRVGTIIQINGRPYFVTKVSPPRLDPFGDPVTDLEGVWPPPVDMTTFDAAGNGSPQRPKCINPHNPGVSRQEDPKGSLASSAASAATVAPASSLSGHSGIGTHHE